MSHGIRSSFVSVGYRKCQIWFLWVITSMSDNIVLFYFELLVEEFVLTRLLLVAGSLLGDLLLREARLVRGKLRLSEQ